MRFWFSRKKRRPPVWDRPPPSEQLLKQRVRNRIIEYLEVAASPEEQRSYERNVPIAQVPSEMINQWDDWVSGNPEPDWAWYGPPVFSAEETEAMRTFHAVWLRVCDDTPAQLPYTVEQVIGTEPWDRLCKGAEVAVQIFHKRGKFNEEVELDFSARPSLAGGPSG